MTLKTYSQCCGLASALDVVGDRWTLLIIRSLLTGPSRFNEIQARLPGIGTNLLAARLKTLQLHGLVTKREGRQSSYALAEKGESLRPVVLQMARWGRSFVPESGAQSNSQWDMVNIEASFNPEKAKGIDAVIEFEMEDALFHLVIRKQTCRAVEGPAVAADVSITSDGSAMLRGGGRMQIHGDTRVFDQVRPCFSL